MDRLLQILSEMALPFAYDHFAEGESPNPPFICYLLPGSDNFSADGRVYYKVSEVHTQQSTALTTSASPSRTVRKSRHKSTAPPLDFTPVVRLFFTSVQSEDLQATSSLLAQG